MTIEPAAKPPVLYKHLNRLGYLLALLLNIAWLLMAIVSLALLAKSGGGGSPESGFIGIGLVFFQFPLWLVCYVPSFFCLIAVCTKVDSRWNRTEIDFSIAWAVALPIFVVLMHLRLSGVLH